MSLEKSKRFLALTNIEFYLSVFNITEEIEDFSLITVGYWMDRVLTKKKIFPELRDSIGLDLHEKMKSEKELQKRSGLKLI